jgi:hypothetical protein
MRKALLLGLLIWIAGTGAIRLAGHHILIVARWGQTAVLYLASFLLTAWWIPRICRRLAMDRAASFQAATLLMLPTLILDPFSCLFFTTVFPNLDPAAAGLFGGWMLICCGGAAAGVWVKS